MSNARKWGSILGALFVGATVFNLNVGYAQETEAEAVPPGQSEPSDADQDSQLEQDQDSTDSGENTPPSIPQATGDTTSREKERSILQDGQRRSDDFQNRDRDNDPNVRQTNREFDADGRDEVRDRSRGFRPQDVGIRFGRVNEQGLTIDTLPRNSVFYRNGLRQGDVVISLDGRRIRNEAEFGRYISAYPNKRVPIIVFRDGREETVHITYEVDSPRQPYREQRTVSGAPYLGVSFEPESRVVLVGSVMDDSPAEQAGLRAGDVILAVNGRDVTSPQDVIQMVASMRPGDPLEIEFTRRVANTTQAVIGARRVEQTTHIEDSETRRETPYRDADDEFRRAPRDNNGRGFDRDGDGDRDRALLPRRRD